MNQQQQDKAAFFAQYIGSELGGRKSFTDSQELTISNFSSVVRFSSAPLELKPLSDITDEEVTELLSQLVDDWQEALADAECSPKEYGEAIAAVFCSSEDIEGVNTAQAIATFDFLRSRGYLIPFRNYSTDQILEMGWAKLREE